MSDDLLDPEAGDDGDDPYCEAIPGMGPHNYQPIIDIFGSGVWLYCTQCGDFFQMDGTAQQGNGGVTNITTAPGQMPLGGAAPGNGASPTASPSGTGTPPGFPFHP